MVVMLTMETSVEDYGIQPCKKQRKEEDPPVKTITNYFSPLSKSVAKVFSPPKSNNIMDYFKSPQFSKESIGIPGTLKNSGNVKTVNTTKDLQSPVIVSQKALKRKRPGKKVDLQILQDDVEIPDNQQTVNITSDDSHQSQEAGSACMNVNFIGSDTAALLAQMYSENEISASEEKFETLNTSTSNDCKKKSQQKKGRNKSMSRKRKYKDGNTSSANKSVEHVSEKQEVTKPDGTEILSSSWIHRSSCTNSKLEVHIDETSVLPSDSVVTVSFEDFLKSQTDVDHALDPEKSVVLNSVSANHVAESGSGAETIDNAPLSAKALTVHVQVHKSPPKTLTQTKLGKKIPSIFFRNKCEPEIECDAVKREEQSEKRILKRKSNVVIEEEDLELAVLEFGASESVKPKSTAEERQQFMKAFRQPTSDAGKHSAKKTSKLQDANEKTLSETVKVEEGSDQEFYKLRKKNRKASKDLSFESTFEQCNPGEGKINRLKKRGENAEQAHNAKVTESVQNKTENMQINTLSKEDNQNGNLNQHTSPVLEKSPVILRRSSRQRSSDGSQMKSPGNSPVGDATSSDTAQSGGSSQIVTPKRLQSAVENKASPLQVSTPKTSCRPLRKANFYKTEMIQSPEVHSPIRMRFTRLNRSCKNDLQAEEEFTPRSKKKVTGSTKTVSEAKKLVKKARNIQHNLSKCAIEKQPPPRRSSRQQAISERKQDHEREDCVFVESSSEMTSTSKRKTEKNKLRSLNDVLGKSCKTNFLNSSTAQGKVSVCARNVKLITGPVTILDDSSKDASESSQDEEQFKAKREFLMSGLPDSMKRHIAKTTAALETYSAASLCYQAVTHVQQKDEGVLMWKLLWPSTPLLTELRQANAYVKDVTILGFLLGTFTDARSKHEVVSENLLSGFRARFSEVVRRCLLEEIRSCNSQFPIRRLLKQFQKRQTENCAFSLTNKEEIDSSLTNLSDSEKENGDLKSKRRKTSSIAELNPLVKESCRSTSDEGQNKATIKGKPTRMSRKKQAKDLLEKRKDCEVILIDDATSAIDDAVCEDVLWTEKYQPQDSSELIGNSGAIKKLHSWLKEWKARADREEKISQKEKKPNENGPQDTWGQSDFEDDSENEEDLLCNTVLITGPSGVGKTAAVYACAYELGFKVFEVNASCQRSGRQILSQLKEATQSHQVDKQGATGHKPCFFNTSNTGKSPRKLNSPSRVVASPRKSPLGPRRAGIKPGLPPKSLATYFKTSSKDKSAEESLKQPDTKQSMCESSELQKTPSVAKEGAKPVDEFAEECGRKSGTSLILFEEVDVIFEDDLGFLNAIKTFMTTTKRPVILTTSDPSFGLQFDGFFEEIYFKSPSPVNVASYLQVLCLAENLRMDVKDLYTLLSINNCDIRRSVLFLQFWIRSGGGYLKDKALSICDSKAEPAGCSEEADVNMAYPDLNFRLPKCDTGCVENFMGLQDILSPSEDLVSYIKCNIGKTDEWRKLVRLLQKFQMENVNFIFNNLELLLPLPVHFLPEPINASGTELEKAQAVFPDARSLLKDVNIKPNGDTSPEVSPVKISTRMKNKRKLGLLDDCDVYECDSNSGEGFLTLPSHVAVSPCDETKNNTISAVEDLPQGSLKKTIEKKLLSPSEKQCSALVSQCLDSIGKFSDDVSFLDCCLFTDVGDKNECINMEYNWTGGRLKNGLCDGCRVENHEWWSAYYCGELKAVVEMLSFQSCCSNIAGALESSLDLCKNLGKDPTDQITLLVPKCRENVYFGQSVGDTSIAKERLSLAKKVFSTGSLMTVGNRQASIVEYLPILRTICKSEKLKEQGKMKRRFLHYFEGIHLELPKATLRSLAADFP